MVEEALGVQLYTPVRCTSCGKVLAGHIGEQYDRLRKIAIDEANESVPQILSYEDKEELILKFIAIRTQEIHEKLGIKRDCCMRDLQYKEQILVGAPSPKGNTIIDRQNMADKNIKRSITRIELTAPSRVPGTSGLSMISLPGKDDVSPEWKVHSEKIRTDLSFAQGKYSKTPTSIISKSAASLSLPQGFNIKNLPITNVGNTTEIKSQYLDMLEDVTYVSDSVNEQMEIQTITNFSQLTISTLNDDIDDNNYRDMMDFEITTPGLSEDLNEF